MSQYNIHEQVNQQAFEMIRGPHLEFSPFEDERPAKKRKKYEFHEREILRKMDSKSPKKFQ